MCARVHLIGPILLYVFYYMAFCLTNYLLFDVGGFPNFALLMGELLAEDASQKMLLDLLRERQEKERERQEKEREILRGQQLEEENERERQEKEREKLRGQQLEEENERERQEKERERQERLQLEQAQQQMYASILRMSLEKQNWQDRLRQEEERRRQEEERRRQEEERRRQEEERHVTELFRQEEELQRLRAEIIRLKQEQGKLYFYFVKADDFCVC